MEISETLYMYVSKRRLFYLLGRVLQCRTEERPQLSPKELREKENFLNDEAVDTCLISLISRSFYSNFCP